jgi:hypothetical protein
MCELLLSPTTNERLHAFRGANRDKIEKRLLELAGDDNVNQQNGMGQMLDSVDHWSKLDISHIRKLRIGRHRFYVEGKHTDCKYIVQEMLVFKRDQDDTPEKKPFQSMIRKALAPVGDCVTVEAEIID